MPFHPIHLAQTMTGRGLTKSVGTSQKDAQVINGVIDVAVNPVVGTKTAFVQKRFGFDQVSDGNTYDSQRLLRHNSNYFEALLIASTSGTATYLYHYDGSVTNLGSLGDSATQPANLSNYACDAVINNVGVVAFITQAGGARDGWFLYSDAITDNFPTFSASLTSGQATAVNIASTTGIYDGQAVSGSGIPASTVVSDIINSSMVLLSQAATESGTKTVTKAAVAKIIDTDFPAEPNSIEFLDTYFYVGEDDGTIGQSDTNNPASWNSANTTNADYSGDGQAFIFRWHNYIVSAGNVGTVQFFENTGNATGIVLSDAEHLNSNGVNILTRPIVVRDRAYFIGNATRGACPGLYSLAGTNSISKVSDDFVDGILDGETVGNLMVGVFPVGNKDLVGVIGVNVDVIPVFDPSNGMFTLFDLGSPVVSTHGVLFTTNTGQTGIVCGWNSTVLDNSSPFTLTIQTEPQDMANGLECTDTWVDLLADVQTSGSVTLSVSDDDYGNWVTKGTYDKTKIKKRINALGLHQGARAYRLQDSSNTNFRGQLLRVNFQPSTL